MTEGDDYNNVNGQRLGGFLGIFSEYHAGKKKPREIGAIISCDVSSSASPALAFPHIAAGPRKTLNGLVIIRPSTIFEEESCTTTPSE
ncbi:hypothetical protein L484_005218 [Morus notabilis]|uniref:Uncharacterized protein n=1 Tax=Morus notabilis TaxID=981085 RepID=W9QYJ4_9ROSA|nr:hypothetical protein L484_005218 [Morus notabilis]